MLKGKEMVGLLTFKVFHPLFEFIVGSWGSHGMDCNHEKLLSWNLQVSSQKVTAE